MGTELTTQEGGVPALRNTPALAGFDASDFASALPRLYKGEGQSAFVQDGLVPKGAIFVAAGKDDPAPEVIGDTVTVYVLDAWKDLQLQDADGELQRWTFGDPEAPEEARTAYHFTVAIPEVDADVPVKLTMAKTSAKTGQRIAFRLFREASAGRPIYGAPFELSVLERKNTEKRYQWFVWKEKQVEATPEGLAVAEALAPMATSRQSNDIDRSAGTEPAI